MSKVILREYYALCEGGVCQDLLTEEEKREMAAGTALYLTGIMQTANKHVRDVVAMSGKAGSEGIARASGLLLAEKYSRRRCKQEKEMGDFHPVHLRGCDCDLLRPIHGTTSAFCCLPSTAGWLRFNRETPYSPRCDCEQNPPQRRITQRKSHPVGYITLT